jgi:hypothetical protein
MKAICLATICLFSAALLSAQAAPASPPPAQGNSGAPSVAGTQHRGTAGTITAIADGKITLKTIDGKSATVVLDDKTQFRQDRQPAKLSDFKVGDAVLVRGQSLGDNQWQAESLSKRSNNTGEAEFRDALGKRFIVGEIKAINGVQLTILRPDGVTQTITVDENTSFRKQGESVTLADFKVGDHVFGRGELKDGVFVPAVLGWGDPMSMFGGQGAPDKSQGK